MFQKVPQESRVHLAESREEKIRRRFGESHDMWHIRRNKYGAVKTEIGGERFDSKLEARFYTQYLLPFSKEQNFNIERQVKFNLVVNGEKISEYIADFVCTSKTHHTIIYECKGMMTPDALIKLRLCEAIYHIPIHIVYSLKRIERLKGYKKRK